MFSKYSVTLTLNWASLLQIYVTDLIFFPFEWANSALNLIKLEIKSNEQEE